MLDFSKIKLIIWDLDETLWKGTLSDNEIIYLNEEFVQLIHETLDRGIVHSICSKNDLSKTKSFLQEQELWELFVFPSISWEPKGFRIKQIIENMKLRPENVLFVDDNRSNIQEALYYCSGLHTCTPEEITGAIPEVHRVGKVDLNRSRLAQYRLLEQKQASQREFSSNESFLMSCNICVEFHGDCIAQLDRIHDLILRSNQLNYTKFRQSKEELLRCLSQESTQAAYVTVKDNFGDYGIVGFYMIINQDVIHYLFSCRTLGMMVEQYVYMTIGCPTINTVGDVVTKLDTDTMPAWINQMHVTQLRTEEKLSTGEESILFKGPCDISQIFSFVQEMECVTTEFTYVNDQGISVEGYNHTSQMVTSLKASEEDKAILIADTPWLDDKMLDASQWLNNRVIVFSMLTDGNLGVYQHKETGWQIALCEKYYDLTDPKVWQKYIDKEIFTSLINFTKEKLQAFADKYYYVDNSTGDITLLNLDYLYRRISPDTKLILILGSEVPFEGKTNPSYQGRHILHKTINDKIRKWSRDKDNVFLIEISKYIKSQKDYTDTINHFSKRIYYYIAQDIVAISSDKTHSIKTKGKMYLHCIEAKVKLTKLIKKMLNRI